MRCRTYGLLLSILAGLWTWRSPTTGSPSSGPRSRGRCPPPPVRRRRGASSSRRSRSPRPPAARCTGSSREDHGAAGTLLWKVALLAIGVTALAAWWIGAGLLGRTPAGAVRGVAALALLLLFLGARRLLASSGAISVAAAHGRRRC